MCGEFSSKFASVTRAAPHLDDPEVIESRARHRARSRKANPDVDAYAFPHNETSTGVMLPVAPARRDRRRSCSSTRRRAPAGCASTPREFDVYYFAPQKCFAGDAGLWLALCSPAAIERIERIAATDRWVPPSLDLGIALEQSRLDQTYNTPALATLFLLADQVEWMLAQRRPRVGGRPLRRVGARRSTRGPTPGAHTTPFVDRPGAAQPRHRDDRLRRRRSTPAVLAKTLRANGILDVEPYRKLGRNQLRIGMFPAIEPDDVAVLTRAIDYIVERLAG